MNRHPSFSAKFTARFWTVNGTVWLSEGDVLSVHSRNEFFGSKLSCLIDQYNQYEISGTGGLTVSTLC